MRKTKYRKQKYAACQLISAINARIFFGGDDISDELFEELVDLVCARNGSAIGVQKAYPVLGLEYTDGTMDYDWIKENLPVAISFYSIKWGFHSALVHEAKNDTLYVINNGPHNSLYWPALEYPPFDYQQRARTFHPAF